MSIEILTKAIKKRNKIKEARIREEEKKEKIEQEKEKRYEDREKKLAWKKSQLCTKILEWRDKFAKTKQFRDIFIDENEVIIYYGGWGHKRPTYGGDGCWSRVYLGKSGKLRYWAGYKWMPTGPAFSLNKKTLKKLSHDYLNKLHRHIANGNVYEAITNALNEE